MEQIENLMNSPMQQQGNPPNNPIEQVEERGASNVDMSIFFSLNYNEFLGSHARSKEPTGDHDCLYGRNEAIISIKLGEP